MDDRDKKMILRETVRAAKSAGIPNNLIGRGKSNFDGLALDKILRFIYSDVGHWLANGYTFLVDSPDDAKKKVKELSCAIVVNGIMQISARGSADTTTSAKMVNFPYFKTMVDGLQTRGSFVKEIIAPRILYVSDIDILSDNASSASWQNVTCAFDSVLSSRISQNKTTVLSLAKPARIFADMETGRMSKAVVGTSAFGATFKDILDCTLQIPGVYEDQRYCRVSVNGKK
jgi:hypothetical protein